MIIAIDAVDNVIVIVIVIVTLMSELILCLCLAREMFREKTLLLADDALFVKKR